MTPRTSEGLRQYAQAAADFYKREHERRTAIEKLFPQIDAGRTMETVIADIVVKGRTQNLDAGLVAELARSIDEIGLLHPIIVCRPTARSAPRLVSGWHRLEAFRQLERETIPARMFVGNTPEIQQWCKDVQEAENNIRRGQ